MEYAQFKNNVRKWMIDRNILEGSSPVAQMTKLIEEASELNAGLVTRNLEEIEDAIGDCDVVLTIIESMVCVEVPAKLPEPYAVGFGGILQALMKLYDGIDCDESEDVRFAIYEFRIQLHCIAEAHGTTLAKCRQTAWDSIKDRKGRMVDGVFVKEVAA